MQNKSEMINRIAELAEENAELKAKIKKYAELNEIDTRDYAALHNENIKLNAIIDGYQPRLQRYKDILQEIKEIAEKRFVSCSDTYCDKQIKTKECNPKEPCNAYLLRQILQLTKAEV